MSVLRRLANRFPRLKRMAKTVSAPLRGRSVSSNYVELAGTDATRERSRLRDAWQDQSIPAKQRELVDRQLAAFHRGEPVDNFNVMQRSLRDLAIAAGPVSLLEIGCSSGYYCEVVAHVAPGFSYTGCDYSPAFVQMAKQLYPQWPFHVEDTTRLSYADASFDVVVSGCCLLHVPQYRTGIAETARVARSHVIFHRTPVVVGQPERIFRKQAYGVETLEIHFGELEFLNLLESNGLVLTATHTLSETVSGGVGSAVRTYVCRKVAR